MSDGIKELPCGCQVPESTGLLWSKCQTHDQPFVSARKLAMEVESLKAEVERLRAENAQLNTCLNSVMTRLLRGEVREAIETVMAAGKGGDVCN